MSTWYDAIVEEVTEDIYHAFPELLDKYGETGREKCKADNVHHFKHLDTAFDLKNPQVFVDYCSWLDGILRVHGMHTEHLVDNLERIVACLHQVDTLSADKQQFCIDALHQGISILKQGDHRDV